MRAEVAAVIVEEMPLWSVMLPTIAKCFFETSPTDVNHNFAQELHHQLSSQSKMEMDETQALASPIDVRRWLLKILPNAHYPVYLRCPRVT